MGEYLDLHILKKDKYEEYVNDMKTFLGQPLYHNRPYITKYEEDSITLTKYNSRPLTELMTKPDVVFDWCFKTFNTKDVIVEYLKNLKEETQSNFDSSDRDKYEEIVDYLNHFDKVKIEKNSYKETIVNLKVLRELIELSDRLKCLDDMCFSDVYTIERLEELLNREDIDDLRFIFTYN